MTYPRRHYTDTTGRIVPLRVASSSARGAHEIALQESERFAAEPAAASIDAVDAVYLEARIRLPDAVSRDDAILAHHEGRPSFALRPNGRAEAALRVVYAGGDLADHIASCARARIGNPDRPFETLLAHHAGLILPALVPVNAAAHRLIDETLDALEALVAPRFLEAAE